MGIGLFEGREDCKYNDVGFVELSNMFATHDAFFIEKIFAKA